MKIIDRYILKELMMPFAFGIGAFTSIYLAGDILFQIADLMLKSELSFIAAIKILLLSLPPILVNTFPMAILLATLLALGRLSGSSEIIAMRAGGARFSRLILPVIIIGLLVSFTAILFNETLVPWSIERKRDILEGIKDVNPFARGENIVHREYDSKGSLQQLIYIRSIDAERGRMKGVTVEEFIGDDSVKFIAAKEAVYLGNAWEFMDGSMVTVGPGGSSVSMYFENHIVNLNDPTELIKEQKSTDEMNAVELAKYIAVLRKRGADITKHLVDFNIRFSIPLASLIFVLIGAPLAIQPTRGGTAIGFGLSLIIIIAYYLLMSFSRSLGESGTINPILASWIQNIIIGSIGIFLIRRVEA